MIKGLQGENLWYWLNTKQAGTSPSVTLNRLEDRNAINPKVAVRLADT